MKRLTILLLSLLWALPALGQIPGNTLVVGANGTPITGGTSGDCLTVGSTGRLSQTAACGAAAGITVGVSTITGGANTRIVYDNAGVVGEYTISGSGTVVAMQTSPSLITPALGVATATSVAIGGCTISTNVLCTTGNVQFAGVTEVDSTFTVNPSAVQQFFVNSGGASVNNHLTLGSAADLTFSTRAVLKSPANGTMSVTNNAATAGFVLDGTTDAAMKLYARDGTTAGVYYSGATAGVTCSGSPTAGFASTNGIVTHC